MDSVLVVAAWFGMVTFIMVAVTAIYDFIAKWIEGK